ncbi:MAG: acylphosphatase [Chloroflexales bacterium]
MERVRAHVFISGRVQGVNFRAYMRDRARDAGVEGWVRNLSDSRVEAIFEGTRPAVQKLVSWCYSGPVHAEVAKVELAWEEPTGKEGSFSILW